MLCFMSKQQLDDNPPLLRLESVRSAVEHLELLGAVERKEGQVLLTTLGKKMASFPLEPRYAKVKKETKRRLSRGNKLLNYTICCVPGFCLMLTVYLLLT